MVENSDKPVFEGLRQWTAAAIYEKGRKEVSRMKCEITGFAKPSEELMDHGDVHIAGTFGARAGIGAQIKTAGAHLQTQGNNPPQMAQQHKQQINQAAIQQKQQQKVAQQQQHTDQQQVAQ